MYGVLLGAIACLGQGSANFVGGVTSRRLPLSVVVVLSQVGQIVLMIFVILVSGEHPSASSFFFGSGAGLSFSIAVGGFYYAMANGPAGIVAPTSGVVLSTTQVIYGAATGEHIGSFAVFGFAFAVAAIVLVAPSRGGDEASLRVPFVMAIISGIAAGVGSVLLTKPGLSGAAWALTFDRLVLIAIFIAVVLARRTYAGLVWKDIPALVFVVPTIGYVAGDLSLVAAGHAHTLAVWGPLAGLGAAVVVVLARLVLHEHWGRRHSLGIGAALAGVLLISLN
jgi:drug/metabolite transporter (DMT)-like permease